MRAGPVQIGQRVIYLADGSQGVVVEVKPGKVTEELGLTRSPGESGGWEGPAGGAGGLLRQRSLQRTRSRPQVNASQPPQTALWPLNAQESPLLVPARKVA